MWLTLRKSRRQLIQSEKTVFYSKIILHRPKIFSLQQGTKSTNWFIAGKWPVPKLQPRTGVLPGENLKEPFIKTAKISSKLSPTLWTYIVNYLYLRRFTAKTTISGPVLHFCAYFNANHDHVFLRALKSPFRFEQLCLFTVHGRYSANCCSMQFNCSGSAHQSPLFDCFFQQVQRSERAQNN